MFEVRSRSCELLASNSGRHATRLPQGARRNGSGRGRRCTEAAGSPWPQSNAPDKRPTKGPQELAQSSCRASSSRHPAIPPCLGQLALRCAPFPHAVRDAACLAGAQAPALFRPLSPHSRPACKGPAPHAEGHSAALGNASICSCSGPGTHQSYQSVPGEPSAIPPGSSPRIHQGLVGGGKKSISGKKKI